MMELSHQQMLALWRRRLGFDEIRDDCSVEVFEGRQVNDLIATAMRSWYLRLLDSADTRLLPVGIVSYTDCLSAGRNLLRIVPAANVRRVIAVEAPRWDHPVTPIPYQDATDALNLLKGPFGAPSASAPLAVDTGHRDILAAPLQLSDAFSLYGIADPGNGRYILDEVLLDTIPNSLKLL